MLESTFSMYDKLPVFTFDKKTKRINIMAVIIIPIIPVFFLNTYPLLPFYFISFF